jgi:hypothetical protein
MTKKIARVVESEALGKGGARGDALGRESGERSVQGHVVGPQVNKTGRSRPWPNTIAKQSLFTNERSRQLHYIHTSLVDQCILHPAWILQNRPRMGSVNQSA